MGKARMTSSRVTALSQRAATSPDSDDAVATRLKRDLSGARESVVDTVLKQTPRDSFIDDRAYRLLLAISSDTPVLPIDPAVEGAFRAEEALGRMPLDLAFAQLVQMEPKLEKLRLEVQSKAADRSNTSGANSLYDFINAELDQLVGLFAKSKKPLIRSRTARTVAGQFLLQLAGEEGFVVEDPDAPVFDREIVYWVGQISLFGKRRPTAAN